MGKRTIDLVKMARELKLALNPDVGIEEIQALIAKKLRVPFFDLTPLVNSSMPRSLGEVFKKIDSKMILGKQILPLELSGDSLKVGFCNPMDLEARKLLQMQIPHQVQVVMIDEEHFKAVLGSWMRKTEGEGPLDNVEPGESVELMRETKPDDEDGNVDAPPIVRLGNKIIVDAVKAGASDIHFEPGTQELVVRFRIDGVMCEILKVPVRLNKHLVSRFKVMSGLDIAEKRKPQDGRMRARVGKGFVDLRISTLPTACGEKVVMRLLIQGDDKQTLSGLGFDDLYQENLTRAIKRKGRMILVTGPTGSGKTTTLYSLLKMQRDGKTNIVTVEDPVEYRVDGINQIQVKANVGLTFAAALKSILRQDPDVIMVGEIRDKETADIAVKAALTGHLVLSSLHTNDVPSTVDRLRDLGIDNASLAASLGLILAQRLVRRPCPECGEEGEGPLEHEEGVKQVFANKEGCSYCRNSG